MFGRPLPLTPAEPPLRLSDRRRDLPALRWCLCQPTVRPDPLLPASGRRWPGSSPGNRRRCCRLWLPYRLHPLCSLPGLLAVQAAQPQPVAVFEGRAREAGRPAAPFVVEWRQGRPQEAAGVVVFEAQRASPPPQARGEGDRGKRAGKSQEGGAAQEEGDRQDPLVSLAVGSVLDGVLQTGIVVYEGAAVPVFVKTNNFLWVGAASLQGERVQVALDRIVHGGRAFAVRAVALDGTDRSPELSARVSAKGGATLRRRPVSAPCRGLAVPSGRRTAGSDDGG